MILLKDVPGLGRRHEVKEVSPGYARNFLIPKKLAEFAGPSALARLEKDIAVSTAEGKVRDELLRKNMEELSGKTVTLIESANEEGHLYAGIHQKEISDAIKKELRLDIPAEFLTIDKPIKETGEFELSAKWGERGVNFKLVVSSK